jgi:hypothetical protein
MMIAARVRPRDQPLFTDTTSDLNARIVATVALQERPWSRRVRPLPSTWHRSVQLYNKLGSLRRAPLSSGATQAVVV